MEEPAFSFVFLACNWQNVWKSNELFLTASWGFLFFP